MRARVAFSALAAVIGFYAAVAVIATVLSWLIPRSWTVGAWEVAAQSAPVVAAGAAVSALLVRARRASWRAIGWRGGWRDGVAFASGAGFGLGMAVAAVAIAVLAGGAGLVFTGESVRSWLATAVTLGFGLLLAALAEELIFRGFPLARLAAGIGKVGASAVLAVLFAGVHLGNPAVSPLGVLNVVLAALVLSAAFFTPGGLPAAWGVHLGWNAGLALGADAPVSGLTFRVPAVEFAPGRLGWVTGGAFGPEGGVGASLVMVIALIWLVWYARRVGGGGAT